MNFNEDHLHSWGLVLNETIEVFPFTPLQLHVDKPTPFFREAFELGRHELCGLLLNNRKSLNAARSGAFDAIVFNNSARLFEASVHF